MCSEGVVALGNELLDPVHNTFYRDTGWGLVREVTMLDVFRYVEGTIICLPCPQAGR